MSTTRETFKRAIARGAPSDDEMRDDLARLLDRIDESPLIDRAPLRPRFERAAQVAGTLAFAASIAAAIVLRSPPREAPSRSTPVARAPSRATHIYIRRSGEPETKATSFTLSASGDH